MLNANTLLIGLTVALSLYAWNSPNIMQSWMMNPYYTQKYKQYFRFLTSGFIHADMMHLFFNMFTLYSFGNILEDYIFGEIYGKNIGTLLYCGLYLFGIIVSEIPTFLKNRNNSNYNSLGASGGVSAVVFACVMFIPMNKICLYAVLCVPGFIYGILYLLYCSMAERRGFQQGINHSAHFWGAMFGVGFSILVYPPVVLSFIQQIMDWKLF